MGKYKIGLRTNMKNSSKVIRIANACFPFLKFCPLTSLSYSLRLQWLQRRSRNQTSFFVGVSAASDRISKKENMHLLSVFPCLSFSYLFSSLFCIFPSQLFSILFQPIFHNFIEVFNILWVSEDHPQLFSILCLGESQRLASLASFKATVHCQ